MYRTQQSELLNDTRDNGIYVQDLLVISSDSYSFEGENPSIYHPCRVLIHEFQNNWFSQWLNIVLDNGNDTADFGTTNHPSFRLSAKRQDTVGHLLVKLRI